MIEGSGSGSRAGSGSGSIPLTKHVDPVDPDSDPDPQHCLIRIKISVFAVPWLNWKPCGKINFSLLGIKIKRADLGNEQVSDPDDTNTNPSMDPEICTRALEALIRKPALISKILWWCSAENPPDADKKGTSSHPGKSGSNY